MSKNQAEKSAILKFVRDRFNTRIAALEASQRACLYTYTEIQDAEAAMVKALRASPVFRGLAKSNPLFKIEVQVNLCSSAPSTSRYGRSLEEVVRPEAAKTHATLTAQIRSLNTQWDTLNQGIILHGITPDIRQMVEDFMKVLA